MKHENQDDGYETSGGADNHILTGGVNSGESIGVQQHQQQQQQTMMPKCEMAVPEDPYNFVDDEMHSMSPHMMPNNLLRPGYSSLGGNGGAGIGLTSAPSGGSSLLNANSISSKLPAIGLGSMHVNGPMPIIDDSLDVSRPKKRGRKKKNRDENG